MFVPTKLALSGLVSLAKAPFKAKISSGAMGSKELAIEVMFNSINFL